MKDEITVIEHIHCKGWFSLEIEIFEGLRVYGHFIKALVSATEGSNKFQAWDPLYVMEFFMLYVSKHETLTRWWWHKSYLFFRLWIRRSKHDGVMRWNIL